MLVIELEKCGGDVSFYLHLSIIKKHYCELKNVKISLLEISNPLNVNILDLQMSMFKFIMKMHAPRAMAKPFDVNPMTKLWITINGKPWHPNPIWMLKTVYMNWKTYKSIG
jgi:hypothetical protein